MADYQEFLNRIDRKVYHEGEWQWQEGEYTVTRTNHWSAPGCHNSCGLLYYTKNGKLEKVEGDPLNPYSNGKLCMRCLNLVETVYHPDRLKWPLKRVGKRGENKWERITWDEAYSIIEEKVRYIQKEYGAESIVGVHGTGRNVSWQLPYFFKSAFDTPNITTMFFSGYSCYLPRVVGAAAVIGDFPIVDASEVFEKRYSDPRWRPPGCIVVWGCEPLKSNADGFLGHWLVHCMQMGSKVIVIDPQLTWIGSRAEYWLPIRPGTDAALVLGLINAIIEEELYDHEFVHAWCDGLAELAKRAAEYPAEKVAEICEVSEEHIKGAARFLAQNGPTAYQWGLALDQQISAIQAIIGIADLMALTGSLDVPGGMNLVRNAFNTHRHYNCGTENLSPGQLQKELIDAKSMSGNHMVALASSDAILEAMETGVPYPIKMFYIQSSNSLACPAMAAPRAYKALNNLEFVVVADPFMTPTAVAHADIVLPVAMNCERNSTRTWWTPLRSIVKVTEYYEAKSDEQIIVELGKRLNPKAFPFKNDIEFVEWYITKDGDFPGTWEDLRNKSWVYWDWDANYRKYEKGMLRSDGEPGFNTLTGKVELCPTMAGVWEIDPLPYHKEPPESPVSTPELYKEYPLILTTGGRSYEFFHSEHRQLPTMREFHPDPLVTMHPETGQKYGIREGDWVWIENQRGRIKQKAKFSPGISVKLVHIEHGWWFPEQEGAEPSLFGVFDSNPNVLTQTLVTGDGGIGSPIKGLICRIYKVEDGKNDQVMPTMQITRLGGFGCAK